MSLLEPYDDAAASERERTPTGIAEFFASVSAELHESADEPVTFALVADRAVEVVDNCDHCGITLRTKRGTTQVAAASSPIAQQVDELQDRLREGPCVEAAFGRQDFVVPDLHTEQRWPTWARMASELGIRSTYAVAIRGEHGVLGALNFHSSRPHAFDDPSERALASVYASHAGEALRRARQVSGLRAALESRHLIGMAQGVLAATYKIGYEQAFEVLRRYASETNTKLRDVAQQVLDHGRLPGDDASLPG